MTVDQEFIDKFMAMWDALPYSEKIKLILKENRKALYIGELPAEYKEEFMKRAANKFDNNFGMCLMDYMARSANAVKEIDKLSDTIESIIEWTKNIDNRLEQMEKKPEEKEPKSLLARRLERKGVETNGERSN